MTSHDQANIQLRPTLLAVSAALLLTAGLFRSIPTGIELALITLACIAALTATLGKTELKGTALLLLATALLLIIHTFCFSPFLGRSLVQAFYFFSATLIYICFDTAQKTASKQLESTYTVFLGFSILHAAALIALYLEKPIRVTGLMEDYSQASLLILFAFALNYSRLKSTRYFGAISLVLFIGFFTTFSRTANAILILFLVSLAWFEWRHGHIKHLVKTSIFALLSAILVYWYPKLINLAAVDRGGLSHFSTLNSRTIYWQSAWDAIKEKPFLGHGLGNFEWTGIKEARPFKAIHHVHNDYLQVWHDLGVIWFLALLLTLAWLGIKHLPMRTLFGSGHSESQLSEEGYFSWVLLCCLSLYMMINFALYSIPIQVAIILCLLKIRHAH
ncbi:O-antigen ligase family protein [Arenicella chitinivorans]|nr:O-antigen ligase family protein [Arenicella chitinivorans]